MFLQIVFKAWSTYTVYYSGTKFVEKANLNRTSNWLTQTMFINVFFFRDLSMFVSMAFMVLQAPIQKQ